MAISRASFGFVTMIVGLGFALALLSTNVHAQSLSPSPTPTSDGTTIDQGIACVLMLVALVLTYLIHSADVSL